MWGRVREHRLYCLIKKEGMYNKQQLKPLNHKKPLNVIEPLTKSPIGKANTPAATHNKSPSAPPKSALTKKPSNGETAKPVKLQRSGQRSTKTIEHYDCDDFELQMEDHGYFQTQLEKNIKTEIMSKTGKPQAKTQIVLPKLEGDAKCRNMKDLERQMDEEMSRMMDYDHGNAYE